MKKNLVKHLLALLLFGTNGIVASHIHLSSYEIVLLRTLIGSGVLLALFALRRQRFTFWRYKRQTIALAASGVAMGASWMFLYEAYQQVGVGIASLLNYCGPVLVMAASPFLFGERLTRLKLLGFAAVLGGVVLINGQAERAGLCAWGLICGGLSALTYAAMVIFNKKAAPIGGIENACLQLIFSLVTVAAFVGLRQGFTLPLAGRDLPWILTLGVVNTGLGCYLYFSSIGGLPVQTVSVLGYLEPLSAVLLSAILLHEPMSGFKALGAALIVGGALTAEATSFSVSSRRWLKCSFFAGGCRKGGSNRPLHFPNK